MTGPAIRDTLLAALHRIAPEADLGTLRDDLPLRDQLDLDSVDYFEFVVSVHEVLRVDVPESEVGRLRTLEDWVRYLEPRLPGAA